MRSAFVDDVEFVERFHREAEALAAIEHPSIVRVFDYGSSADGPYIAMELVEGGTLRDLMRARGRVDQYDATQIAAQVADGLEAAHLRGVLHRDLKPDNILLDSAGHPKIADFGIARLAAATALTHTGELLGTPRYLAPEQMSGDTVDERADVYALGVILYEMVTGMQPTGGTTPSEIVSRRLQTDPRPPSRFVPLAPAINGLVLRALARDPAHRFRRAADLRAALLAIRPLAPAPARRITSSRNLGLGLRVAPLALLAAFVGGSLVFAGVRPVMTAPASVATVGPAPTAAVLASASGPAVTVPMTTPEPTAVPSPEPARAVVAAAASPDPARTILTFYQLVSGHDYDSASGLWSDRMRATYPPQTNIWGRFDATRSIVARSASVTSAGPASASVAVDLIETLGDGSVRHWIGTWYLVRSGPAWLLDQPGLRPA
jgi:serine/threonine-protein kinase